MILMRRLEFFTLFSICLFLLNIDLSIADELEDFLQLHQQDFTDLRSSDATIRAEAARAIGLDSNIPVGYFDQVAELTDPRLFLPHLPILFLISIHDLDPGNRARAAEVIFGAPEDVSMRFQKFLNANRNREDVVGEHAREWLAEYFPEEPTPRISGGDVYSAKDFRSRPENPRNEPTVGVPSDEIRREMRTALSSLGGTRKVIIKLNAAYHDRQMALGMAFNLAETFQTDQVLVDVVWAYETVLRDANLGQLDFATLETLVRLGIEIDKSARHPTNLYGVQLLQKVGEDPSLTTSAMRLQASFRRSGSPLYNYLSGVMDRTGLGTTRDRIRFVTPLLLVPSDAIAQEAAIAVASRTYLPSGVLRTMVNRLADRAPSVIRFWVYRAMSATGSSREDENVNQRYAAAQMIAIANLDREEVKAIAESEACGFALGSVAGIMDGRLATLINAAYTTQRPLGARIASVELHLNLPTLFTAELKERFDIGDNAKVDNYARARIDRARGVVDQLPARGAIEEIQIRALAKVYEELSRTALQYPLGVDGELSGALFGRIENLFPPVSPKVGELLGLVGAMLEMEFGAYGRPGDPTRKDAWVIFSTNLDVAAGVSLALLGYKELRRLAVENSIKNRWMFNRFTVSAVISGRYPSRSIKTDPKTLRDMDAVFNQISTGVPQSNEALGMIENLRVWLGASALQRVLKAGLVKNPQRLFEGLDVLMDHADSTVREKAGQVSEMLEIELGAFGPPGTADRKQNVAFDHSHREVRAGSKMALREFLDLRGLHINHFGMPLSMDPKGIFNCGWSFSANRS
jgi:hypothetical protein